MNIRTLLHNRVRAAMTAAGVPEHVGPAIAPAKKREFGDYQANGAMAAAKAMGVKPRDLAQSIVDHLDLGEIAANVELAGPGFINIHLNQAWLSRLTNDYRADPRLGIAPVDQAETVVIDYSAPNLAKEMHVGHLRSTIIGDTQARLLEFLGHKVIRQNHVGDWGTQFGMLIAELEDHLAQGESAEWALHDLESFYLQAKVHFDRDADFATKARNYVVKLQSGDEKILTLWRRFRDVSLQHSEEIYRKLNISLTADDVCGESFYNHDLPAVIEDLRAQGLARENQGAQVVFLEELADQDGNPSAVIVQKQDGGYLYSTTDLAAVRYRTGELKADRIMIFVDARQSLHLQQVFLIARKAGFAPTDAKLEHHHFGTMLGPDGKPFRTRDGGTVKLAKLVDEAVERADRLVAEKDPGLSAEERRVIAKKVGIGAVKYADLSKTRTNDYLFSWDAMLSFEGNTAPYLQYAYTRIQSIFRKAGLAPDDIHGDFAIQQGEEKALALKCLQLVEVLEQVGQDAYPHQLCNYLYDLASQFMGFYENCPILKTDVTAETRDSRLQLCAFTAATLELGLGLLGIEVMDRM